MFRSNEILTRFWNALPVEDYGITLQAVSHFQGKSEQRKQKLGSSVTCNWHKLKRPDLHSYSAAEAKSGDKNSYVGPTFKKDPGSSCSTDRAGSATAGRKTAAANAMQPDNRGHGDLHGRALFPWLSSERFHQTQRQSISRERAVQCLVAV